jgi:hypothetical protein
MLKIEQASFNSNLLRNGENISQFFKLLNVCLNILKQYILLNNFGHTFWGGRKPTYLTSVNIRIDICINAFSVVPWGSRKQMSVGKIQMLDGLVSTHCIWGKVQMDETTLLLPKVVFKNKQFFL